MMNTKYAENFIRSAMAPEISAGVMMANIIWNAMNRMCGIVDPSCGSRPTPFKKANSKPPMNPPPMSDPNASE